MDLEQTETYVTDNLYAFMRGNKILVALTNVGQHGNVIRQRMVTQFEANQVVCNVLVDDDCINVNSDHSVEVVLVGGEAKLFVRQSDLL